MGVSGMKWKDIPQFPSARYAVEVPWTSIDDSLDTLRGEVGELRLDPDYQRPHVWTPKQQAAYVEFQLMGGELSRTLIFNAPWWQDTKTPPEDTYVELLDGKQRMEAVRAFVRGDLAVFGRRFHEFEGRFPTMEYRFRFQVCCLETRVEVLQLYLKINSGGTPHSEEELGRVRKLLEEELAKR